MKIKITKAGNARCDWDASEEIGNATAHLAGGICRTKKDAENAAATWVSDNQTKPKP